jgi:phospholipase/carboxylesterase
MALRYGVPRPDLFTGLAVLSGSLRRVAELRADMPAERKQAIFVAHGLDDPLVPIEWSRALVSLLEEDGYQPVYKTYPIGHAISPAEIADLKKWIGSVLPPLP